MTFWTELFVILGLILVSGVFAGAEIALLSVRKTRLGELASNGSRGAAAALKMREDPERLLATIQVAITVLGAATAVFGGARLEGPLAAWLARIGVQTEYAESISFVTVVGGISYFSLVFGELVPKSMALRNSVGFTLVISRLLVLMSRVTRPAVWLLTFSSNLVLRGFRDSTSFSESRLSPEELQQLVEEASTAGSLPSAAGEIASRAIGLAELRVKDVMIPRQRVVGIPANASSKEVLRLLQNRPHGRYPVYEQSIDDPIGYVTARDLYQHVVRSEPLDLRALKRPLVFLPEASGAVEALTRLREARQRFALVIDETGGVVGVVTIADIAEELVGEVLDENEAPQRLVVSEEGHSFLVRGEAPIHEVERVMDIELSLQGVRAATIAGLVIERLGEIPKIGTRLQLADGVGAEVLDASERRIRTLRLHRESAGGTAES